MSGLKEEGKESSGASSRVKTVKQPDSREGRGTGKGNGRENRFRVETKVFTSGSRE